MSRPIRLLLALALFALPAAPSCDNHVPLAPLRDGQAACDELKYYCEDPAKAFGEPYQSCYDDGENGVKNTCLGIYDDCIVPCKQAKDMLDEQGGAGGQGGEGGQGGASGDAGGGVSGDAGGESGAAVGSAGAGGAT